MAMTYEIAHAAGMDAANRLKRAKGLQAWDDECLQVCCDTFEKLYPDALARECIQVLPANVGT